METRTAFAQPRQPVDHAAHQIAEIEGAMQTVEELWRRYETIRADYRTAVLRLQLITREAQRHG